MIVKFNKNIKFEKFSKIFFMKGYDKNLNFISGNIILISTDFGLISLKELEASRRFLRKFCKKKKGILHIRVIPFQLLTFKSVGIRMGKGKGKKVKDRLCRIRPGKILFEFEKNIKKQRILSLRLFINRIFGVFFILKKRLSLKNVKVLYKI